MANVVLFDVDEVKKQMDSLEEDFKVFSDVLKSLNDYIETMVNAGADSAIYGQYGTNLLNIWNANASNFGDFQANFESWNEAVAIISANNEEFTVKTTDLYRDNAGTLSGIKEARDFVKEHGRVGDYEGDDEDVKKVLDNASKIATVEKDDKGNVIYKDKDGNTLRQDKYDEDGNLTSSVVKDKDGNILTEYKTGKDGKITKIEHNADGSQTEQVRNADGTYTTTIKDKDGNVISSSNVTYSKDGKIATQVFTENGVTTEVSYGANGKQSSVVVTDENGKITTINYGTDGKPVSATVRNGNTVEEYKVGESGKLELVKDSGENPAGTETGDTQATTEAGDTQTDTDTTTEASDAPADTDTAIGTGDTQSAADTTTGASDTQSAADTATGTGDTQSAADTATGASDTQSAADTATGASDTQSAADTTTGTDDTQSAADTATGTDDTQTDTVYTPKVRNGNVATRSTTEPKSGTSNSGRNTRTNGVNPVAEGGNDDNSTQTMEKPGHPTIGKAPKESTTTTSGRSYYI